VRTDEEVSAELILRRTASSLEILAALLDSIEAAGACFAASNVLAAVRHMRNAADTLNRHGVIL
jgi:hypothetical protein